MHNFTKTFILSIIFCFWGYCANAADVLKADIVASGAKTEFFIRLSTPPQKYNHFYLSNPNRLVLDISDLEWRADPVMLKGVISKVRYGKNGTMGRVVLDLKQKITRTNVELLPHPRMSGLWLLHVVMMHPVVNNDDAVSNLIAKSDEKPAVKRPVDSVNKQPQIQKYVPKLQIKTLKSNNKSFKFTSKHQFKYPQKRANEILVVIDAGHGGNDPGAISVGRKREKDVTLRFSKELYERINSTYGMRAILTRDSDFYIPLAERVAIAQYYHADLFISIHADSLQQSNIQGGTIYTLSDTASDDLSAAIAQRENKSDIIAGVTVPTQEPEITDILIDLVRRETDGYSYDAAGHFVTYMSKVTKLMKHPHRRAGFAVLKAPDIPSLLIELGYLTNIYDERKLMDTAWRAKVITQMVRAIKIWHINKKKTLI